MERPFIIKKIEFVKTFEDPKLMYRAAVIPISKVLVKETNPISLMVLFGMEG